MQISPMPAFDPPSIADTEPAFHQERCFFLLIWNIADRTDEDLCVNDKDAMLPRVWLLLFSGQHVQRDLSFLSATQLRV